MYEQEGQILSNVMQLLLQQLQDILKVKLKSIYFGTQLMTTSMSTEIQLRVSVKCLLVLLHHHPQWLTLKYVKKLQFDPLLNYSVNTRKRKNMNFQNFIQLSCFQAKPQPNSCPNNIFKMYLQHFPAENKNHLLIFSLSSCCYELQNRVILSV